MSRAMVEIGKSPRQLRFRESPAVETGKVSSAQSLAVGLCVSSCHLDGVLGAGSHAQTTAKAGLGYMDYVIFDGLACAKDTSIHTIAAACTKLDIGLCDILGLGDHVSSAELDHDLESIAAARTTATDRINMRKAMPSFSARHGCLGLR